MTENSATVSSPLFFVGHRGFSEKYPENTMLAFAKTIELSKKAPSLPVRGIELDLHLTKDGKVVVMHDMKTGRTTTKKDDKKRKAISRLTLAELKEYDAGEWKGLPFKGQRVPTLDEVLKKFGTKTFWYLELKMARRFQPRLVQKVIALVRKHKLQEHCILHSFHPRLGAYVKKLAPELKTGFLFEAFLMLRVIRKKDYDYLHPKVALLLKAPQKLLKWNLPLNTWTVKTKAELHGLMHSPAKSLLQGLIVNDLNLK